MPSLSVLNCCNFCSLHNNGKKPPWSIPSQFTKKMCEWDLKSTIFTLMALTVRSTLWSAPLTCPQIPHCRKEDTYPCIPAYSTTKPLQSSFLAMLQLQQEQHSFVEENLFSYFENPRSKPLYKIVALSSNIKEPSCKAGLTDWIYLTECFIQDTMP